MKVLHISSSDSGGAGTAALRLHIGLLKQGIESKFLCLKKNSKGVNEVFQFPQDHGTPFLKRMLNWLGRIKSRAQHNQEILSKKKGSYEIFTFPETDYRLDNHPLVLEADIINLHWVANYLDYPTFFRNVKKPIVWTLHDMNAFQGGFHYTNDRNLNWEEWKDLELALEQIKLKSLHNKQNVHVVTPSIWLGKAAESSAILGKFPLHTFFYGLNLNTFKPLEKAVACAVFSIPKDSINVFFIAESIDNNRKGFDLLISALKCIKNKQNVNLIIVGQLGEAQLKTDFKHFNLGQISDNRLLNVALNTADVFILPSREDNLPNVMVEAMACGIPVISFPVGGMAEVIKTGYNGIVANDVTSESLAEAIQDYVDGKYTFERSSIRQFAIENFSEEIQANNYNILYKKILVNGTIGKLTSTRNK